MSGFSQQTTSSQTVEQAPASSAPVYDPYAIPVEQDPNLNTQVNDPYAVPVEQIPASTPQANSPYDISVEQYPAVDTQNIPYPAPAPAPVARPARRPLFGQSIFSQSAQSSFGSSASGISVTERNAVLESLTNYDWTSTNKYNITNKYTFRIDDNGLIMSYAKVDTKEQSPEYYLYETPRGYQLDFPNLSAHLKFWLSENGTLVRSVKAGNTPEDIYAMTPQARSVAYDDNIF